MTRTGATEHYLINVCKSLSPHAGTGEKWSSPRGVVGQTAGEASVEGAWPQSRGEGPAGPGDFPIWPGSGDAKDSDCEDMAVVESWMGHRKGLEILRWPLSSLSGTWTS